MNEIMPALQIRFEDFVTHQSGEHSILTSMALFQGRHPTAPEVDSYLRSRNFEVFSDQSGLIDYLQPDEGLSFRDCHPANWVAFGDVLIPIDIIPEWLEDRDWESLRKL